jgi:hypothetical protein
MGQLKNEFNAFKEQQTELNQSIIQRLNSIEAGNQSVIRQIEEYNGTISTVVQIQSMRNELVAFEGRIRILEGLNQSIDSQVIS